MKRELIQFTETTIFRKQIDRLGSLEILFDIQNDLLENPEKGEIIVGTNGARKARIGDRKQKRGKSGSFRYIYVYFNRAGRIYLLLFYAKGEQDTLTKDEKKEIAEFIGQTRKNLGSK